MNALGAGALPGGDGAGFTWTASSFGALPSGFNLIATGDQLDPSQFLPR